MKRITLVLVLVFLAFFAVAAKKESPKDTKESEVIMATTDDGRRVALFDDGTWKFVAGDPAKKEPEKGTRELLWTDLVAYFETWQIEQIDDKAGLIKTAWNRINTTGILQVYEVRVSIVVKSETLIERNISYRGCDNTSGCVESDIEFIKKMAQVPGLGFDEKKVVEYDTKLRSDLDAIEAKYKK